MMPGTDGWQVLEALHGAAGTHDLPVVIVTSHALEAEERSRLADAFAIVSKQDLSRTTLAPLVQAAARRDETSRRAGSSDTAMIDGSHGCGEGVR